MNDVFGSYSHSDNNEKPSSAIKRTTSSEPLKSKLIVGESPQCRANGFGSCPILPKSAVTSPVPPAQRTVILVAFAFSLVVISAIVFPSSSREAKAASGTSSGTTRFSCDCPFILEHVSLLGAESLGPQLRVVVRRADLSSHQRHLQPERSLHRHRHDPAQASLLSSRSSRSVSSRCTVSPSSSTRN